MRTGIDLKMSDKPERILLRSFQAIGDVITLSALPKAIHAAYPGRFEIYVSTSHMPLWFHNPNVNLVKLSPHGEIEGVKTVNMHYPSIAHSNRLPSHFISAWMKWFSAYMKADVQPVEHHGDLHLSEEEKAAWPPLFDGLMEKGEKFWLMISGWKNDFTAKAWPADYYQKLVDLMSWNLTDKIKVLQIGGAGHVQPKLRGTIDLIGRTTIRDVMQMVWWAEGCISGVTFLPHMSAAIPMRRERFVPPDATPTISENKIVGNRLRPCVVISGGREPAVWEQYPGHQFLQNVGTMDCNSHGGCWRDRCQEVGDGDAKDAVQRCLNPIQMGNVAYPKCMTLITPEDAMRAVMRFYEGGTLSIR
jgi:hypothetical protein